MVPVVTYDLLSLALFFPRPSRSQPVGGQPVVQPQHSISFLYRMYREGLLILFGGRREGDEPRRSNTLYSFIDPGGMIRIIDAAVRVDRRPRFWNLD